MSVFFNFFFENSLEEWLRLGGQQLQYSYRSPLLKKINTVLNGHDHRAQLNNALPIPVIV